LEYEDGRYRHLVRQVPDLLPKAVRDEKHREAGQEFVFIPKGRGVLLMPVPELEQLAGIARGACTDDYRDREDRY
jgi:predicted secreted protein